MSTSEIKRVCVFCASSDGNDPRFVESARQVGKVLANSGKTIIYGGGAVGCMGALANSALECDGSVVGVLPHFMNELEWGHTQLTKLELVSDMRVRKQRMIAQSDAVVALPGGSGTYEELFEVLTMKRLGLFFGPIVLVNTNSHFELVDQLLKQCVNQSFMNLRHLEMWKLVDSAEALIFALENAPTWDKNAREFAAVRQ